MSLEYKHLEPDQQIEAKLTISLSTESSIEWLKSNALKKNPQNFFSGSTDLKDFVNSQYAKRKDPTLSLAVARYGTHIETLKELYRSGDHFIKMAILANSLVGPADYLVCGIIEESEAEKLILDPNTPDDQIHALFTNPNINREFLEKVVKREGDFKDLSDDMFSNIVIYISLNPICSEKYDDTFMDGYAEYSFGKLPSALFSLISIVPVNRNWAITLKKLLEKLALDWPPNDISLNVKDRWFNPEKKDDQDEASDLVLDSFHYLRKEIAKTFFRHSSSEDTKEISPNHQDQAIREVYYENITPGELFGGGIYKKDFSYPSFEYLDEYDQDAIQEKVVSTCKKYYSLDKDDFLTCLTFNLNFWKRKQERGLLRDLSWHLPNKDGNMDAPNLYNGRERIMLREYPHFFVDDDFADIPEELSLKNEISKINEKLEQIYSHQEIQFKEVEEIEEEAKNQVKKILDVTNQQLEKVSRDLNEISEKNIIQQLIDRIETIERKQLSTAWMWLIIILLILILLTKH